MSTNKTALITGSSQGIGRAIAIKLAIENFDVAITARNKINLEETADIIKNKVNQDPLRVVADLQNPNDIQKIFEETFKAFGHLNVLINNAGIMFLKPFLELSLKEFEQMLQVNLQAVFFLTQLVVKKMIEQKINGTIINIASLAGKNGFKTGTGYAASKWALRGFSKCLLQEVRENDIRVITIFPGSVDTNLNRGGTSPTGTLKQNKIQPEDIAETVYMALEMSHRTMISEIDMRPTNPHKV